MRYAIKIGSSFLEWCSDTWYGTTTLPMYNMTLEKAKETSMNLKKHYVYEMDIVDEDGDTIHINHRAKAIPDEFPQAFKHNICKIKMPKKTIFKLNASICKKSC